MNIASPHTAIWYCLVVLNIAGLARAHDFDARLDTPFSNKVYVIRIIREHTSNGVFDTNYYKLFYKETADQVLSDPTQVWLSDGTGGQYRAEAEWIGGPFQTLREVCGSLRDSKARSDCHCPTTPVEDVMQLAEPSDRNPNQRKGPPPAPQGLGAKLLALFLMLPPAVRFLIVAAVFMALASLFRKTPAEKILAVAQSRIGSQDYLVNREKGAFRAGKSKCNLMVAEVIMQAGLPAPLVEADSYTKGVHMRYPHAAQWSDPNQVICGYGPGEKILGMWVVVVQDPQPGDVAATSGHVGIVADAGHTISTDNIDEGLPGIVHYKEWGFRPGENPTFRRWMPI